MFYEGPPTANGRPGSHHVISRIFKDIFPRYKTMRGYRVPRKAGWDTHGLPVELEVERSLGINGKKEIEQFGVAEFNRLCRESVLTYLEDWDRFTERIGFWVDLDDAYYTFTNDYIETVWWLLRTHLGQGAALPGLQGGPLLPALRHGHLQPRGRAGLQGGRGPVGVRALPARAGGRGEADRRPAPAGQPGGVDDDAVDAHQQRGRGRAPGGHLRARGKPRRALRAGLCPGAAIVLGEQGRRGARAHGRSCWACSTSRRTAFMATDEPAHCVVGADYVTTTDGTGIVHIAPAFGEDDMRVGRENDLPLVNAVDTEGRFVAEVTPWAGALRQGRRPADHRRTQRRGACFWAWSRIATATRSAGAATRRCSTTARPPGTSAPRPSRTSCWPPTTTSSGIPEHIKQGRFGEWLANNVDWALSRDRYWGTPLPIWRCENGHAHCVGSVAELRELAVGPVPDDLELHRPFVDDVRPALPGVRPPRCAARPGGHRRVVRLGRHAVRTVALPVREPADLRRALPGRLHLPRPSTRRAAGSTACWRWPPSSKDAARTSACSAWGTSWTPRARR